MADSPAEHDPETTTARRARSVDGGSRLRAGGSQPRSLPLGRDRRPRRADVRRDRRAGARFRAGARVRDRPHYDVDLGPTSLYPVDKSNPFHVVTFTRSPTGDPDIERRVVFIRNDGGDTFTAISNTCMHLGCPVRAFGSSGFGCPCHGGQYDSEGRRIAGPPVRPLNRYATNVVKGHLILGELYAMDDSLHRHQLKAPGQPVTGLLSFLYPPAPQ